MQMAISTTGRRPLCIFCSVSVLSKMLKLRSAEGSSFWLWWLLSVLLKQFSLEAVILLVVEAAFWCLLNAVSRFVAETALLWRDQMLVAESHHCARYQTHWVLGSAGPSRSGSLQQCWVFWGETFQMVNMQWLEPSVYVLVVVHQMVCFWGGPLLSLAQWSESLKSLSECCCLSSATRLRRLMSWCCWALWVFINPFNIAYR